MTDRYIGYGTEELKEIIKECERVNEILWEYIRDKDIEEIYNKIEKIDD
jgi:hypothetical protein